MTDAASHPLDRPIWTALTTRQASLAEGGVLARRYPTDIAPFAALAEPTPECFAALHAMMVPTDRAVFFTLEPVTAPVDFEVVSTIAGEQMTGAPVKPTRALPDIVALGESDAPEMRALVDLTKPGPFGPRTHRLGTFLGVKVDGKLVAMTGERMKPENYTELTAVCVHPDHRGHGYAQALLYAVSQQIFARGEIPFLHVFANNASAIALYLRQGMEIRTSFHVTALVKRG